MQSSPPHLVELLAPYGRLVEVGIGERPGLAADLVARGATVTATDIESRSVPEGISFVRDDITDPRRSIYRDAEAIYARRLPPELQRPTLSVSRAVGADLLFTTLGGDSTVIPATPRSVVEGTVFVSERG
ncbi:MAG: UPF0146 family protein [Halodesulfurarchaeum sp.]